MDFDQTKKIEVEVSENVIAENEVGMAPARPRRRRFKPDADRLLDIALIPVIVGVFVSLGFLFAGLFGATNAATTAAGTLGGIFAAL